MKCRICNNIVAGGCICGYCLNCLEKYGHKGCERIDKQQSAKEGALK
jgi:hypothetical protein